MAATERCSEVLRNPGEKSIHCKLLDETPGETWTYCATQQFCPMTGRWEASRTAKQDCPVLKRREQP